jgi:hypothetical protein
MFRQADALTDAAPNRLGEFLKGARAMNVEQLHGFFAASSRRPRHTHDYCAL